MVTGYLGTLTTETRVILHLNTHKHKQSDWSAPLTLTQSGISEAVFVQRKHIPRTLNKLVSLEEVEIMKKHIPGGKQRRQIYLLSEKGRHRAKQILSELLEKGCQKSGQTGTIGEFWKPSQPILEFLSHFDDGLNYSDIPLNIQTINRIQANSLTKQESEELIHRLFEKAWMDGRISRDEQILLGEVILFLDLESDRVTEISEKARRSPASQSPDAIYFEMLKQALMDGEIVEDENALLQTLKAALKISDDLHLELMKKAREESQLSTEVTSYKAALETAMKDGKITEDEQSILLSLRKTLGISDIMHEELFNSLSNNQ